MAIEKTKINEKELEALVVDMAKKGMTNEKIGLVLKKEHGIKKAKLAFGKRISQILKENDINTSPDIENLKKTVEKLQKHLVKNKHDQPSKRALIKRGAKLRKLELIDGSIK